MTNPFHGTTPILRSFSENEAKAFYVDWLGFTVLFEHRFEDGLPLYMGLGKDACALHLSEHHGDASPGAHIRIAVSDVQALCDDLNTRPYPKLNPGVQEVPWGGIEMTLTDPFSNKITFYNQES
ncbi:MAG: glyoxalase superfamily protein [Alphaproteobacteria bacterium]